MDRRELFKSIVGAAAVSGVPVKASSYPATPAKPALVVIECDHPITNDTSRRLTEAWEETMKGTPFEGVKAVVLTDGLKLTILDATGNVLNRTVELAQPEGES